MALSAKQCACPILVCLLTPAFYAAVRGSPEFAQAMKTADEIIVGEMSTADRQRLANGLFRITVLRVLKGTADGPGMTVSVRLDSAGRQVLDDIDPRFGLLVFLRTQAKGASIPVPFRTTVMTLSDFALPVLKARIGASSTRASNSIVTLVASELARAIEADPNVPALKSLYVGALETLDSNGIPALYERLAHSHLIERRALGIAGLIRRERPSGVIQLAQSWDEIQTAAAADLWLVEYSLQVYYRNPDPSAIGALATIATQTAAKHSLRMSSAYALKAIHTASCLRYFAELIESDDIEIQMEGIRGFGMFANRGPCPESPKSVVTSQITGSEVPPFRTADTVTHGIVGDDALQANLHAYVRFWRDWWAQHRQTSTSN
jgi:hypothetical protein